MRWVGTGTVARAGVVIRTLLLSVSGHPKIVVEFYDQAGGIQDENTYCRPSVGYSQSVHDPYWPHN